MEDLLNFGPLALFALLVVLDVLTPARTFPQAGLWRLRGLVSFAVALALFSNLPFLWDELLGEHRLIDATELGTAWGAMVGLLVVQFVQYWWHRAMHNSPFLWRWFHQMHHSAERIDVFGAFYFHPLDVAGFAFVGSFSLVMLVGVTPEAALIVGAFAMSLAFFQHSNLKTPAWLGYLIARPENHALHHERDIHGYNYGDISLWDMVFGTFRNPATWEGKGGFYDGASTRVLDMLRGRDVSRPAEHDESKSHVATRPSLTA